MTEVTLNMTKILWTWPKYWELSSTCHGRSYLYKASKHINISINQSNRRRLIRTTSCSSKNRKFHRILPFDSSTPQEKDYFISFAGVRTHNLPHPRSKSDALDRSSTVGRLENYLSDSGIVVRRVTRSSPSAKGSAISTHRYVAPSETFIQCLSLSYFRSYSKCLSDTFLSF